MVPALIEPSVEILKDEESVAERATEIFNEASPTKVVLAGGSTPRRAYELVSRLSLRWSGIDFFLSDERFVPPDDDRSNERMVREALGARLPEGRLHGIFQTMSPDEAADLYAWEVAPVLPFDLTILGLGADGHTASLFPEDPGHDRTDVLAFATQPAEEEWRVSLSLAALNQSRRVIFLVTGEDKASALASLIRGEPIPASKIRPIGDLSILADRTAARLLGEFSAN